MANMDGKIENASIFQFDTPLKQGVQGITARMKTEKQGQRIVEMNDNS